MNQELKKVAESSAPLRKDGSFSALVLAVSAVTAVLAWGWLRQTPSHEELFSDSGRFLHEFKILFLDGPLKWWTSNFMQGGSSATYFAVSLFLALSLIFEQIFGSPNGLKILGLLTIPACAFGAYAFVRKLTENGWTAFIAGLLYALNAQLLLRIANFEHVASAVAYVFIPLILLLHEGRGGGVVEGFCAPRARLGCAHADLRQAGLHVLAVRPRFLRLVDEGKSFAADRAGARHAGRAGVGLPNVRRSSSAADAGIPMGGGVLDGQFRRVAAGVFDEELHLGARPGERVAGADAA